MKRVYFDRISLRSCGFFAFLFALLLQPALGQEGSYPWVGTWGVAPVAETITPSGSNPLTFSNQTVRQIVRTSVGGSSARIHISNVFGTAPLTVQDVQIALSSNNSTSMIVGGSNISATFQGQSEVTIPAGSAAVSDPINFTVPALGDVAISIYFPSTTAITNVTTHVYTEETNFYSSGDVSGTTTLPNVASNGQYYFLTGLDVPGASQEGTFVTVGASITDGYASTNLANHRWPNYLAQRLQTADMHIGVLNEGIAGNQMLTDNGIYGVTPEHRFNRDVLTQPGVQWLVLSDDPINDLGDNSSATATELIAAIQQLIGQAHQVQLKFLCSTLTPYEGASYWTATGETYREEINTFIKSSSSGCDGVVDQAAAIENPSDPEEILPAYDSGDHLHPNDAGYQAIANAVNLSLFTGPPPDSPYGGATAAVPGTVLAENYDTGGQAIALYVTSINGTADSYRADGVDLETATAPATGNDLGWTASGQWFHYTVNVATAGTYKISFLVAGDSAVTDAFHLSNAAGTNLTGSVAVPSTGGWQTWTTVTATVTLSAGTQTLTLNEDNGGWNIDSMAFASTGTGEAPFGGIAAAIPGTVMTENYDTGGQSVAYNVTSTNGTDNGYRSDGVDLETATAPATGNDLGWTAAGQWFQYTVNVATAGTYKVSFLVAGDVAVTDAFHLSNTAGTNMTGSVAVPSTGGWQDWTTITATVTLPAGTQTLTLNEDNGGWNIDSIAFASGTVSPTPTPIPTATPTPTPTPTPTATPTPIPTPTATPVGSTCAAPWAVNVSYSVGQIVSYSGENYKCLQAHTSLSGWEPPNVPALWSLVGLCN